MIRPARPDERQALEDLQRRASLAHADTRVALLAHPEAIELPPGHLARTIVAAEGNDLVGFAVLLPRDDGDAELDGLFVEPAAWRRGIGARLVQAAAAAWAAGCVVHVVANPNATAFYTACGFVAAGEVSTRFGPGTLMQRPAQGEKS